MINRVFIRQCFVLLPMLLFASHAWCKQPMSQEDSLLVERIYSYQRNYTFDVGGFKTNVYIKHLYQTHRRNFGLWLIPSTYSIAKGKRSFVSEQYNRLEFKNIKEFTNHRQVYYTTIPHNRRTLPTLFEFITPSLYDVTMYGDHVLSPFCRENKVYYRYTTAHLGHGKVRLYFRPRFLPNTQLVKGRAIVDASTGRIEQLEMEGEYDMIRFRTLTMQGEFGARSLLPRLCKTSIEFKFAGNHVTTDFTAVYDCPITLPDTLDVSGNRELIESVRPISLSREEAAVYHEHDSIHNLLPEQELKADSLLADSLMLAAEQALIRLHHPELAVADTHQKDSMQVAEQQEEMTSVRDIFKKIGWDMIGYNLLHSLGDHNAKGYIKLSPIINPQYVSYSSSRGLSYKMKLSGEYHLSNTVYVSSNPYAGYSVKKHEFYFETPFWLNYRPENEGCLFLTFSKNSRIGNGNVMEEVAARLGSEELAEQRQLHIFDNYRVHINNHWRFSPSLAVELGVTHYYRNSIHANELRDLGLEARYNSLAPSLALVFRPWKKAPVFTIDYERTINSPWLNMEYERWEADVSGRHSMTHLQALKLRLGGGIYTRKKGNTFMDFSNFHDNNLPEGWDDDWSGDFQLLDSRLYNESKYYVRSNITYESPLLAASFLPFIGRYVEREQTYWNALSIAHTRLYSELGYGFTSRYFSMGFFASFLNLEYQRFTTKFTFELFSRW